MGLFIKLKGFVKDLNSRNPVNKGLNTESVKLRALKEKLLEYKAKNSQELAELKKLESEFASVQAHHLVEQVRKAQRELLIEERDLQLMVEGSKPVNDQQYHQISNIIQYKLSLYYEQGRTPILCAYNQHRKDCGGDSERITKGVLAANEYWGKESGKSLTNFSPMGSPQSGHACVPVCVRDTSEREGR